MKTQLPYERVKISSLILDPDNAREHDERNLSVIKESLKRFEQQRTIVVSKDNIVIAGNGTVMAAKQLGWETIDITRSQLTGEEAKAFALVDNRSTDLSTYDDDKLRQQLEELEAAGVDMTALGWTKEELALMSDSEGTEGLTDEDDVPEIEQNVFGVKIGDIWQLGNHRIMCGDSTDKATVEKLMNGEKADMVFTDPPYGMNYQSNMRTKSKKFDTLANDDKIITEWLPLAEHFSVGFCFIWTTWKVLKEWLDATSSFADLSNLVVWDKGGGGIGDLEKTFSTDHEIALVFHRGAKLTGKRIGSVWNVGKDSSSSYVHPTQKPVALAETAFNSVTLHGAKVLDLFLGSGSTLIACEKTGRKCFGLELDPHYCSVIIKRWQDFTGKEAIKL